MEMSKPGSIEITRSIDAALDLCASQKEGDSLLRFVDGQTDKRILSTMAFKSTSCTDVANFLFSHLTHENAAEIEAETFSEIDTPIIENDQENCYHFDIGRGDGNGHRFVVVNGIVYQANAHCNSTLSDWRQKQETDSDSCTFSTIAT
jgi:hypothetical protein